MFFKKW